MVTCACRKPRLAEFVRHAFGLTLTAHAAQVLTASVNGWIAGVVLSLHSQTPAPGISLNDPGDLNAAEAQVFEFLASQVLTAETDEVRRCSKS